MEVRNISPEFVDESREDKVPFSKSVWVVIVAEPFSTKVVGQGGIADTVYDQLVSLLSISLPLTRKEYSVLQVRSVNWYDVSVIQPELVELVIFSIK